MPKDRGQSLAARLRETIEARNAERERARVVADARQQRLREERLRLVNDLRAFGEAVEHIAVSGGAGRTVFRFEGRELRVDARGDRERVRIAGTGIAKQTHAFLHEELNRWVLSVPRARGTSEQLILFDKGLEHLMATALGLSADDG